jgi:hypothetical protein
VVEWLEKRNQGKLPGRKNSSKLKEMRCYSNGNKVTRLNMPFIEKIKAKSKWVFGH